MWARRDASVTWHGRSRPSWDRRSGVVFLIVAAVLAVLASPAEGAPADRSSSPVFTIPPPSPAVVGSSQLVRTDRGVAATLDTSGLPPGHAVTLWMIVANEPGDCEEGIPGLSQCGPMDHVAGRGDISVHQAGGRIAAEDGTAHYGTHLRVGDTSRALFAGDPGLVDPRGAEVILILKTHGPKIPRLTSEMLSTFAAGCEEPAFPPTLEPRDELVGTPGPNDCAEIQISVHGSPS